MKTNIAKCFTSALLALSMTSAQAAMLKCEQFEVAFSPAGGAEELVIKTINAAQKEIRILSYSFTSKTIVRALLDAKKRGVQVALAADASNLESRPGTSALSALASAGVAIRTVSAYKILHDKVIIVDGKTVEFGSFNFSQAAAMSNSENANVCWNAPEAARLYLAHWQSRWDRGTPFSTRY